MSEVFRTFETGATRDTDDGKLDPEGFLAPAVLERYSQYLHKHRKMRDGSQRASDNWQKGLPRSVYMKSLLRHLLAVWLWHRTSKQPEGGIQDALCGVMFNAMGYLFELLREGQADDGGECCQVPGCEHNP